jgi:hypothetical protein
MAPFLADIEISPRGMEATFNIWGMPVEPAIFSGLHNREIMPLATRRSAFPGQKSACRQRFD